ncbi:MAG: type 1 glutamine amidotransferase domain-containing protein [Anaerolineae bacterium]
MQLTGANIVVLAEDLYEDMELWYPYYRLLEEGASVTLVGPEAGDYASKHGYVASATEAAAEVDPSGVHAVVVPGGYAPDKLRRYPSILDLVREVYESGGVVAFICHAAWVPISAGIVAGRRATCVSAIRDDLENAGATYVDAPVVVDERLVSSRTPDDLPQYLPAIISEVAKLL